MNPWSIIAGALVLWLIVQREAPAMPKGSTLYDPTRLTPSQRTMANLIIARATAAGLDPAFMVTLAVTESSLRPDAVGADGRSTGLFQFLTSTAAKWRPGVTQDDLKDPALNTDLAMLYMQELMASYPGRSYGDYAEAWTLGGPGRFSKGRRNLLKRERMTQAAADLRLPFNVEAKA